MMWWQSAEKASGGMKMRLSMCFESRRLRQDQLRYCKCKEDLWIL